MQQSHIQLPVLIHLAGYGIFRIIVFTVASDADIVLKLHLPPYIALFDELL